MENPFKEVYRQCNTMTEDIPFPRMIDIEVTNACNMECRMCPVGTGKMKRKTGFMRFDVYSKIVEELYDYGTPLRFIRWGEPTLHPELPYLLRYTQTPTHVNTNGSVPFKFKDTNSVKFSFQGLTPKEYKQMRGEPWFWVVMDSAEKAKVLGDKKGRPFVSISTTAKYGSETEDRSWFKREAYKRAHHVSTGITMLPPYEGLTPNRDCHEVFNKLSINWDGTVSACCRDYDNMMIVGDLRRNTLAEIWAGSEMEGWRERIRNGDYSHPLCKDCYKYIEMEGE